MKKIIAFFLVASVCLLGGCNTVKGVGKDVANGGRDIERAATTR